MISQVFSAIQNSRYVGVIWHRDNDANQPRVYESAAFAWLGILRALIHSPVFFPQFSISSSVHF